MEAYSKRIDFKLFLLLVSIQLFVYGLTLMSLMAGFVANELFFDKINVIAIMSLIGFIAMCALGLTSTKLYFVFLVFQIVAFPSIVDNFLPGVFFGDQMELHASITPLLTHIDFFIGIGIIKGLIQKKRLILVNNGLLVFSILILLVSSLVNIFYSSNAQDYFLIISGFMHLRYLVGLFILFSMFDPIANAKFIVIGLIISINFLFIEAIIFSYINGLDRLTSGSLGNNTFGNIIACISVYLYFVYKGATGFLYRVALAISVGIGIIIVVFSQTRMAMLSGFVLFCIGTFYYNKKSFRAMIYLGVFFGALGLAILYFDMFDNDLIKRFDFGKIVSQIHLNWPGSGEKIIDIDYSVETASLLTRLELYETSINMISSNPVFGIGSVRWDYHKAEYGFNQDILLDTHNGYLAIVSQFGLLSIVLLYFIYLYPLGILRSKKTFVSNTSLLALISIGMGLCDLSNAGIYKHQVFGLLSLSTIILIHVSRRINQDQKI